MFIHSEIINTFFLMHKTLVMHDYHNAIARGYPEQGNERARDCL